MKIAIYGKPIDNPLNASIPELIRNMQRKGFEVDIYERFVGFLNEIGCQPEGCGVFNRKNVDIKRYQFLVSVGGDGTLLDTATLVKATGVPVIGINTGRLGFISSATVEELDKVCDDCLSGKLKVQARTMLELKSESKYFAPTNFALNELTVLKKDSASMIRIDVDINGESLNSYWADGLIVSTPTGSTAYSLSCGGPIVMPGSENFVITPIAPHNLNVRPVVVPQSSKIGIEVSGRNSSFLLALDSRPRRLKANERLEIHQAPFFLNLIQPVGHSFLTTLRAKLSWGYDKRN